MHIDRLISIASSAYPDGLVGEYHIDPKGDYGDGLAKFVALELKDTFDPEASDIGQLEEASKAIGRAVKELQDVEAALCDRAVALVRSSEDYQE